MAVTFSQEPGLFSPATNPILYAFSSDQTGQPNFSYKVELYIDTALFGTYEIYPMSGPYAKFDASEYVRSFLKTHTSGATGFICETADQWNTVGLKVYESYGNPPALEDFEAAANIICFNAALRYEDFVNFDYQSYYLDPLSGISPGWLTTYPRLPQYTNYADPFHAGILAKKSLTGYIMYLRIYDITGAVTFSYSDSIGLIERVLMLDISPNGFDSNGWTSGTEWNSCYYYEVEIKATSSITPFPFIISEPYRIYYDQSCSRFTPQKLYWMNKFGVIEQYEFKMYSEESTSINSYGYQVQPGQWVDGGIYALSLNDSEKRVNMKTAEDRITLNTDWMKPAVQNWLVRELYESPQVWLWKDGSYQPVILENKDSRQKTRFKDGLIQETVVATITWSYRSQLN
jgi:hypothetical protein